MIYHGIAHLYIINDTQSEPLTQPFFESSRRVGAGDEGRRRESPVMQFSLRSLLIVTVIVAVLCSLTLGSVLSLGDLAWQSVLKLIPAALVTGIVYGRGDQRTFSIGCAASYVAGVFLMTSVDTTTVRLNLITMSLGIPLQLAVLVAAGLLAVWLRRQLESSRDDRIETWVRRDPTPPPPNKVSRP
jgi:hypothetical protein